MAKHRDLDGALANLQDVTELGLSDNNLTELPAEIGQQST